MSVLGTGVYKVVNIIVITSRQLAGLTSDDKTWFSSLFLRGKESQRLKSVRKNTL